MNVFVTADFGPYGRRPRRRRRQRPRGPRPAPRPVGLALRRRAGHGRDARRDAVPGLHAVLRTWRAVGWDEPGSGRRASVGRARSRPAPPLDAAGRRRRAAAGGRTAAQRRLGRFRGGRPRSLRRRPRPARPRHHQPPLALPAVGLPASPPDPRPARATIRPTSDSALNWRGASSTPTSCSTSRRRRGGTTTRRWTRCRSTTTPTPSERFAPVADGWTGYPIVDAGMRQLLATGWMHNRLRMLTASFLVKDLHLPWQWGARHFLDHLVDGDLASNNHGWQWVAGTGTDAAPYFRVFNPVVQGQAVRPRRRSTSGAGCPSSPGCPTATSTPRGWPVGASRSTTRPDGRP